VAWYKVSGGRLRFRGDISRGPFEAWAATPEGTAAIAASAATLGFCLLGKARTARRRMWRDLRTVAAATPVRALLDAEPDRYLAVWSELAYAPALPRVQVSLRRAVVIPRTMIAARTLSALTARLMAHSVFAALDAPVRAFFCSQVIREMDDAIRRAAPTTTRPIAARESWACIAIDDRFMWVDPLWSGREWQGHVIMFEMPDAKPSRKERKEIEAAVAKLQQSLPQMTVAQRDGAVRSASAAMRPAY
jgi:hypothetical protein